jgi:hypothetical protein
MTRLNLSRPPFLPVAPQEYESRFHNQHSDVLRLYFNQMDNALASIIGGNGGQYVDCPNGLFFNTVDQTIAAANTAYPVVYDQTYLSNAVSLSTTSRILIGIGGIYNFQYSGQILSTNSSSKDLFLWIRRNGVDIGYSARAYSISGSNAYAPIAYSFNIDMQKDEYLELIVSASDTTVKLDAGPSASPHPGIPSSVMTVNFIAPLPEPRPTPP